MSVEKAYNQWSSQYDTNKNRTRDLDKAVTIKVLSEIKFQSVLELGCGTGKNTEWLQTKASRILAVDFSDDMMQIAKAKTENSGVSFQKADITKAWDWTSENFDLITCSLILEHVRDLDFIFSEAFKNLNMGGFFFISELHPFKQYKGSKARFETEDASIELETYTHHISEFINSATSAGFKLKELEEWFDSDKNDPPRILSLLFQKP